MHIGTQLMTFGVRKQAGSEAPRTDERTREEFREKKSDTAKGQLSDPATGAKPLQTIRLSSFAGMKPVALIFGSYTCPPFRSAAGRLRAIHEKYKEDVEFFLIYIREAHALDSAMPMAFGWIEGPPGMPGGPHVASGSCAVASRRKSGLRHHRWPRTGIEVTDVAERAWAG